MHITFLLSISIDLSVMTQSYGYFGLRPFWLHSINIQIALNRNMRGPGYVPGTFYLKNGVLSKEISIYICQCSLDFDEHHIP